MNKCFEGPGRRRLLTAVVPAVILAMTAGSPGKTVGQPAPQAATAHPQLVWVDTDIGDDIDDAFALGLIVRSPELKLLGISTAFGDTEMRARLVDRYLAA